MIEPELQTGKRLIIDISCRRLVQIAVPLPNLICSWLIIPTDESATAALKRILADTLTINPSGLDSSAGNTLDGTAILPVINAPGTGTEVSGAQVQLGNDLVSQNLVGNSQIWSPTSVFSGEITIVRPAKEEDDDSGGGGDDGFAIPSRLLTPQETRVDLSNSLLNNSLTGARAASSAEDFALSNLINRSNGAKYTDSVVSQNAAGGYDVITNDRAYSYPASDPNVAVLRAAGIVTAIMLPLGFGGWRKPSSIRRAINRRSSGSSAIYAIGETRVKAIVNPDTGFSSVRIRQIIQCKAYLVRMVGQIAFDHLIKGCAPSAYL